MLEKYKISKEANSIQINSKKRNINDFTNTFSSLFKRSFINLNI